MFAKKCSKTVVQYIEKHVLCCLAYSRRLWEELCESVSIQGHMYEKL